MQLRPYQKEAVAAVHREWSEGRLRTLLAQATGTGKTVEFSQITKDQVDEGERVLQLAHREELLTQASDKLKELTGLDTVLEKAESTSLGSFIPVTVGSIQSMAQPKRLAKFPADYFQTIIVDEAHHAMSDSYQRVLMHFPNAKVLGVTATPNRGDKKNLGEYFDSMAYEYPMAQAIKDGYLVPIRAQMIPLELNLGSVKVSNGDYNAGDIGCVLEPYLEQIADEMVKYCRDKKTVVFLPLIATSQKFCRMLKKRGLKAAEVNGNSEDRTQILDDFENGRYDILCNSMLLTEGWDCPSVDCVCVLRPTKVRGLYQQMVGRGTRLYPGKKDLLLLDFLWLTERHDLCRPSALISKDAKIAEMIDKQICENDGEVDIIDAEEQAKKDVLAEREASLARELATMRSRKRKLVDPLQFALSIAAEDLTNYVPTFMWEQAPPSEKQIQFLEGRGIYAESVPNCGMASMLIDRLKRRQQEGLATPKQIRCLEKYGFRRVGTWFFDDASRMISMLANNHWQVPYGMQPAAYTPQNNILSAFKALPVAEMSRADWITIGMAFKEEGYPCSIWADWSRNHPRYHAGECVGYVINDVWQDSEGRQVPLKGVFYKTAAEFLKSLEKCPNDLGAMIGDWKQDVGTWIHFNPLDGNGGKNENVTRFTYALVESDTLPIAEQDILFRKLELPIAVLVYSGGKLLHAIVKVDVADYDEYRKRGELLYDFLEKNNVSIDKQNRNPSRLSRLSGVTRNGKRQYIVATNIGCKSWMEWMDFAEA